MAHCNKQQVSRISQATNTPSAERISLMSDSPRAALWGHFRQFLIGLESSEIFLALLVPRTACATFASSHGMQHFRQLEDLRTWRLQNSSAIRLVSGLGSGKLTRSCSGDNAPIERPAPRHPPQARKSQGIWPPTPRLVRMKSTELGFRRRNSKACACDYASEKELPTAKNLPSKT